MHANAAIVQPTLPTDTYAMKRPKILAKSQRKRMTRSSNSL